MPRTQKDPLRPLTPEERTQLEQIARAKALPAVADGRAFTRAAQAAGRRSGDAVGHLVARFNVCGIAAVVPGHGGGPRPLYTAAEREKILSCAHRPPDRAQDGTATWSLSALRQALRPELPKLNTYTIWCVLHEAGLGWPRASIRTARIRSWRGWRPPPVPGTAVRRRSCGAAGAWPAGRVRVSGGTGWAAPAPARFGP